MTPETSVHPATSGQPETIAVGAAGIDEAVRAGMWWSDGERTVAGHGSASSHEVASGEAGALVRSVIAAGAPGAFFTASFDPDAPTRVIVPDVLDLGTSAADLAPTELSPQTAISVSINESAATWARSVARAAAAVADPDGPLEKVALTRAVEVTGAETFDPRTVLGRLAGTFPSAYLYSIGGIVGASPELLGQVFDGRFCARALAGTIARAADPTADAEAALGLLRSPKDRHEHDLLVQYLVERYPAGVDDLAWSPRPEILTLANVHHLMTVFDGRLTQRPGALIDLVASVHPTPAVAGVPQADALAWIRAHEPPRGRLCGFAGWTDRHGQGQAALVIRSLEIDGRRARLVVGNGIVGDSDPAAEVRENQAKVRGVLDAVTTL